MADDREVDFRALFEAAPGLYLVLRTDLTIVAASDAYLAATMTKRNEILGRGIFDVFPDNPAESGATGEDNLGASLRRVLASGHADTMAVQKYDVRRPAAMGGEFETRWWSPFNVPVHGPRGDLRWIIHRVEDVTEFVRLREREHAGVQRTAALASAAERMEAEVMARAQELQAANAQLRLLQAGLERAVDERTAELRLANDGLRAEMIERRRAEIALHESEARLQQSQKLEAIGRLAGGVAHDFNNLLTVILSYSEMLRGELESEQRPSPELDEVIAAGRRAAELTRQLLAFGRQQVLQPKVLDLNRVVSHLKRMIRRLVGDDVDLVFVPGADLGRVLADPGQIEQLVVNLVVNARDAMPQGGKLTIESANAQLGEEFASGRHELAPGEYVMLAVSDTGVGMAPEVAARVFEPFFTTKEAGRGTGLGLAMVHGVVQQSGGAVSVYSEPGHGTTFKIYLPRVDAPLEAEHVPVAPTRALAGHERVVVLDDAVAVREVAVRALRGHGYAVIEAGDAVEAFAACTSPGAPVDLLVTDVVMPAVSGPELARRVREVHSGVRVLYMSGYTDQALIHQGLRMPGTAFLQKPFTPDALARRVREILDAATAGHV